MHTPPRALCAALTLALVACSSARSPDVQAARHLGLASAAVDPAAAPPAPLPTIEARPSPQTACPATLVAEGGAFSPACPPREAIPVDLSDDWTPGVLAPAPGAPGPAYRPAYRAAARRPDALVAYGVFPTLSVVRDRLADAARHACHDAVDDAVLDQSDRVLRGWRRLQRRQRREAEQLRVLRAQQARGEPLNGWEKKRLAQVAPRVEAIRAVKAHLRCEGHDLDEDAVLDFATLRALKAYQIQNMLLPTRNVDPSVRRLMRLDSRAVDYRAALRVLRARVAEAGGLLADGSAGNAWQTVMGHHLEDDEVRHPLRPDPLPDALPDHVSQASEAAARALGWTSPEATLAALRDRPASPVWVKLPFRWDRHAKLALRAEIDRGDVWYDDPYTASGARRHQPVERLPSLTVFIELEGRWRPAVRWPVTIGGWKKEQKDGHVALSYEGSPVGPVVWRDVFAAPVWLPPPGIPDETLITREGERWVADRDDVGPGPTSAFGLAMVVHHEAVPTAAADEPPRYVDRGIRVHGTGALASVVDGDRDSHGCHRAFPHLVLRLTNFLLRHRAHVRHGPVETRYRRLLRVGEKAARLRIDSRGYRYELTPPVPVEVFAGRVRGRHTAPIRRRLPLPEHRRSP